MSSASKEEGLAHKHQLSNKNIPQNYIDVKQIIPDITSAYTSTASEKMQSAIEIAANEGDSVGGILETVVTGVPAGIGEPWFDSVESMISHGLFSIPGVKGVEFGLGFDCAKLRGSENNDPYYFDEKGQVRTRSNNAGGILGGLSTGMPILFRVAIKPTPSIAKEQESIHFEGGAATLQVKGRHDPCIVPRAVPVIEAAAAIAIFDAILA